MNLILWFKVKRKNSKSREKVQNQEKRPNRFDGALHFLVPCVKPLYLSIKTDNAIIFYKLNTPSMALSGLLNVLKKGLNLGRRLAFSKESI